MLSAALLLLPALVSGLRLHRDEADENGAVTFGYGNTLGTSVGNTNGANRAFSAGGDRDNSTGWPDKWMIALEHGQLIAHAIDLDTLFNFTHAKSGDYSAQTIPIPEYDIPALKAQHAVPGWQARNADERGRVTSFPSYLALASSWDKGLVGDVALAVAEEFKTLGANTMLGPALNIHRATQHDEEFDSLSGEDPTLGSVLVRSWILATSTHGIMSIPKHIGRAEQGPVHFENSSANMTSWDIYYPPFETAIDCGAAGIMCASHEVNGLWSCRDKEMLERDLKGIMHFQGMVMADTAAAREYFAYASSFEKGLDLMLDEPEIVARTDHLVQGMRKAATRVLASIWHMRLEYNKGCQPPNCGEELAKTATTPEHQFVAKRAAASAIVLLKNQDNVLPLTMFGARSISVVGPAARKPLPRRSQDDPKTTWHAVRTAGLDQGISVMDAMGGTDLCVVLGGSMGKAQPWNLDSETLALIDDAAKKCKQTVVLLELSGTVLTPWRDSVQALATVFHKGPETAFGWAAMLFGTVSPSGKLPVSFPVAPQDVPEWWTEPAPSYWEGLPMAFPFGHGLSYAKFDYGEIKEKPACHSPLCFITTVTNTGSQPGSEVVQVYFKFPTNHPTVLRGFYKTRILAPGESEKVFFSFTYRDVSLYQDVGDNTVPEKSWVPQESVTLLVGSSSKDIRRRADFKPKFQ